MVARKSKPHEYPDDIFADTRMTFGEHIEELRTRMIRSLAALMVCLVIGFILDAIGASTGYDKFGVGRPMMKVITDPVETQVRDFYYKRAIKNGKDRLKPNEDVNADMEEIGRILKKLEKEENSLNALTSEEKKKLINYAEPMPVILPVEPLAEALSIPKEKVTKSEVHLTAKVLPAYVNYLNNKGQAILESKQHLNTMSVQEGFVIYFKVSIICGLVLASPIIAYQFWSFIGAGLYPHEKRYVSVFFWPSLILFLVGFLLCQFWVLPGAVKALLGFNELLDIDPEIRLREWIGLALILPLVFGLSFQTPLVMIFLNRIGTFTAEDYRKKWKVACFILACFAAVITPTPDAITMMYLFVPMFGLYLAGVVFCTLFPGTQPDEDEVTAEEVAV
jgi:sec-independent protein translocase protein TatC